MISKIIQGVAIPDTIFLSASHLLYPEIIMALRWPFFLTVIFFYECFVHLCGGGTLLSVSSGEYGYRLTDDIDELDDDGAPLPTSSTAMC